MKIRSALLHLNIIAIHPFNDGNGRTARILAAMELVRDGIRSPELISVEAYLRRNRDEYIDALRITLGPTYDPDNRPVTAWLDYYTRITLDRLEARNRLPADGSHGCWRATESLHAAGSAWILTISEHLCYGVKSLPPDMTGTATSSGRASARPWA